MRLSPRSAAGALTAFLLTALIFTALMAGCGFLSDDDTSLSGVYESDEFRVRRADGDIDDVGDDGAALDMTLAGDGHVTNGRLVVPAAGAGPDETIDFTGSYEHTGDGHVSFTFDGDVLSQDYFDTGTPLAKVEWLFYEKNGGMIGADDDAYVLFLDREGDAP